METRLLLLALSLISFSFSSCSKEKDEAVANTLVSELPSNDALTEQGCLSIPKLYTSIQNIDSDQSVLIVPTSISFDSANAIRDNFRKLVSYGQLVIAQHPFSDVQALPPVSQDGCATFTVTGTDGVAKVFTIKNSAADLLSGEAEDGEVLEYKWISRKSIQTKRKYLAYDAPCSASEKPIFVTITKALDWSVTAIPASIPESGTLLSIERNILSWAAQAVGDDPAALYITAADGSNVLDVGKVMEMTQKPPRPEVVSCTGAIEPTPTPTPTPEPTPGPDEPPHEGDEPPPNP